MALFRFRRIGVYALGSIFFYHFSLNMSKSLSMLSINIYVNENMFFFYIFFLIKKFKASLIKHTSVEVCVELPKFRLTLIRIQPFTKHGRGQTVAQTADGGDLCHAAVVEKESGHRDLAYVLHTSGTTGLPKIVRVPHTCILPNILHLRSVFLCLCLHCFL